MKDFGVSFTNLDKYRKFFHSLHLKAMNRKMSRKQLEAMESLDKEMAEEQLAEMESMDRHLANMKLKEMNLNIRASF
ncbi:hypothetical protein MTR_5g095150 [Medicago truncatula]|uniref:Uncharacterized protein n=1 Tax=Medicago truncatula TaxID=3880 RepID=G7K4K3_MEDTR|nr:hypothetical protein MTR_5g095150 [Medicago truncatula]